MIKHNKFGLRIQLISKLIPHVLRQKSYLYVLVAIFFSNAIPLSGQSSPPTIVPVAREILSNSHIKCFYKDSKGYMWIGTEDGLFRFDGRNAFRYANDPNDHATVPHNTINAILETNDETLWIGTARGLSIYNRELNNFINVDSITGNQNFLNNTYITTLEVDAQGRLWIGTHEGGINIYNPAKRSFDYIFESPEGGIQPSCNFITRLININDTIWCASKKGLMLFDTRTKKRLSSRFPERLSKTQISNIVSEETGQILISTIAGELFRLISKDGEYLIQQVVPEKESGEKTNRILAMCLDQKGNILLGGENMGLNVIGQKNQKNDFWLNEAQIAKQLPTQSIETLYVDDLGLVWIGTFSKGVLLLDTNQKKFKTTVFSKNLPFEMSDVRGFTETPDGNIWIASYGTGLAKVNPENSGLQAIEAINSQLSNKNVTSIIHGRQGELWLGTAGKGVYRINPKTNHLVNHSLVSDGFGNDEVFCLYEDTYGTIWAGTWGSGLFYFDETKSKFVSATEYGQPDHIPNTAYITDMLEDSDGIFWVGTLYGLYELKKRSEHSFSYRAHLPGNSNGGIRGAEVNAILEGKNKELWIGTTEGLNVKKKGSSEFLTFPMGYGSKTNAIRSLLRDDSGNIWFGGNSGLSKFDASTETYITYTREDGLKSNSFHRKAAIKVSSGKFFFGHDNGFDSFYPDSILITPNNGKIVLTDLKINNQSVKPGDLGSPLKKHISLVSNLELSYEQRSFVIDFVALDHLQAMDYSFCYKLEGFDKEWNCPGTPQSATYTNIDPGNYVFLVKAANPDGVWMEEPLRLTISIQQVFWKTWWAFIIYVALLGLVLYVFVKARVERLKLKNQIMFEKLSREQEQKLSNLKSQFFTNVAHEFRTPLSLIMIPLESLMEMKKAPEEFRKSVLTAFKNATRMNRLVNELMDFNKLEAEKLKLNIQHGELVQFIKDTSSAFTDMAEKRNIGFSVKPEIPNIQGWFDPEKLERILFNVLSNAFKFTDDGGQIELRTRTSHSVIPEGALCKCIELEIEDNGMGIMPNELPHIFEKFYQAKSSTKISSLGTGVGLSLAKALVELHHGTIEAESAPGRATIFKILIPIDKNVFHEDEHVLEPQEAVFVEKHLKETEILTIPENNNEATPSDKPKILLVEDNQELRNHLVTELKMHFTILEAKDGAEGLAISLEKNPDLIISDIMMPVKDGIELCQAIKSDLKTSHIPFILLTAKATIDDQIKGIETGADLYIAKPFSIRYLITHVNQIISSRQQLYARFSQDISLMPRKASTNTLDQEFLQKAIDYIISNLQDSQLGVDSIAALFNLSRMQVYRKIKALTGKSVVEFIRMVRMRQAIQLMESNKHTLSEIAFEVGFNSASYFTRCFKEEYGKTPSEYLQQA